MKSLAHFGTIVPECRRAPRGGLPARVGRAGKAPRHALAFLVMAALFIALTGCATSSPQQPPAIRGVVSTVDLNAGGTGTILVEGRLEDDTSYDRAVVTINASTQVFDTDGRLAQAGDIAIGANVECWFTGPVAESYPVQATASDVRILGASAP